MLLTNKLGKSLDIQESWKVLNPNVPLTRMCRLFLQFAAKIPSDEKEELAQRIAQGKKFSTSLDKRTSQKNRRNMSINLNLSDETVKCFGMGRIKVTNETRSLPLVFTSKGAKSKRSSIAIVKIVAKIAAKRTQEKTIVAKAIATELSYIFLKLELACIRRNWKTKAPTMIVKEVLKMNSSPTYKFTLHLH